jgi:hypothetical protein
MSKPTVRIENWKWRDPDREQLCGQVYGHPHIEDGHNVVTSLVLNISDGIVETRNTIYALGKEDTNGA